MRRTESGEIIFDREEELPIGPQSLGRMAFNKTGTWRNVEPFYQDLLPPCTNSCTAGEDIAIQMGLVAEGKFGEALDVLRLANPFPAICGRVCPHPCEDSCLRQHFGGAISIAKVERFLGDWGINQSIRYEPLRDINKCIGIVGSGPAGLSAGFYLARLGFKVEIFEALEVIGGLLRTGIPEFRLPRDVLDAELRIFDGLNVSFRTGIRYGDKIGLKDLQQFDAALVAVGRYQSRRLGLKDEDHLPVLSGIELLRRINSGELVQFTGSRVAVIGGGATAFDCVRSLMRLGRRPVMVYRRSEKEMPAFRHDIEEAAEEGVEILFLSAPTRLILDTDGRIKALECIKMRLGQPDSSGRRRPEPIPGSEFRLEVDSVVKALGEDLEADLYKGTFNVDRAGIVIDEGYHTNIDRIFACGDCARPEGTVVFAIAAGRKAAFSIASFLLGEKIPVYQSVALLRGAQPELVRLEQLNPVYIDPIPRPAHLRVDGNLRARNFCEVNHPLSQQDVLREASRCISCGTCTYCDNCSIFCPDRAIHFDEQENQYKVKYEYCKGCLVCAQECPRGSISIRAAR
jgi:NADPH-dependent glutamate synthase beta subunit-like oxidoreductase/Pyruvate/2-oxoacid:ferredoxin oxidoreductase delta subunit